MLSLGILRVNGKSRRTTPIPHVAEESTRTIPLGRLARVGDPTQPNRGGANPIMSRRSVSPRFFINFIAKNSASYSAQRYTVFQRQ